MLNECYQTFVAGFCDSEMSADDVLDIIKNSVKTNLSYIDKVIIICSGRIENKHQQAIKNFLEWLQFPQFKEKFVFIYNKSDGLTEAEKLNNVLTMCETFGAYTKSRAFWREVKPGTVETQLHEIDLNLALGFPPNENYETVEKDHKRLMRAATTTMPDKRIPVKKSSCKIM